MTLDLTGSTALVTGGTSGIGFEVAKGMATLGAHVIITGRDKDRLALAKDFIRKDTGRTRVTTLAADFARLSDVRACAQSAKGARFLINNAGTIQNKRYVTDDGFETQWQVNVLAPTLLAALMAPEMADMGHIVNVASEAHKRGALDLEDTQFKTRAYSAMGAYGASKRALIMITQQLAKRYNAKPRVNAVHPGVVRTNFASDAGWVGTIFAMAKPFCISPRRGGGHVMHVACSPFTQDANGQYFVRREALSPHRDAQDTSKQDALMALVCTQLDLDPKTLGPL